MTDGNATILDHAYAILEYIDPKHKTRDHLARKHAGGLGKRRKFIAEIIAILEVRGAKRFAERDSLLQDEQSDEREPE